jgi:hypothetical protein
MTSQRVLLTRKRFKAAISKLNRRLAKPSGWSLLEMISSIVQVLAIVLGGGWVLFTYLDFQKRNNELAYATARITKELSQQTLQRSREGRLDVAMDSSIARSFRFEDGTFLYRYHVLLKVKNISESAVFIPAVVAEFFIGTMPKDGLKPNEALYVNLPTQWQHEAVPGSISWTRGGVYAQSKIESPIDEQVKKDIQAFPPLAVDFASNLPSGTSNEIGLTFLIRSRPDAVAGAVITFWVRTADGSPDLQIYTNTELLSEAEDVPALKKNSSDSKDADRGAMTK